ncbi:MAG: TatD family hydrolase [Candidatus Omnitrophica bacterium]|nr:TatD family hydrolase [Candidatus Omnitrophota bacterium]
MLIDTHCHLDFPQFDEDREAVIKRAADNKVKYLISVGSSIESSIKSKELADKFDHIFFSVGQHPHCAEKFDKYKKDPVLKRQFESLFGSKKLVAIGEVGLDYYRNLSAKDIQKEIFRYFIGIAKKLNLVLIVHCRESEDDTYAILKDELTDFGKVVFHCFSGTQDFFDKCFGLGAMFSFTANITYPNAVKLKELVREIPLDRIMLETDSPYLPPQKYRGQRNEPSYVQLVAQEIALLKNTTFDEVSEVTTRNAERFFKLNG